MLLLSDCDDATLDEVDLHVCYSNLSQHYSLALVIGQDFREETLYFKLHLKKSEFSTSEP